MSGNQQATSFGDSTAQPPTPKQTPTSSTSFFPSPVFETPKIGFANSSNTASTTPGPDWTPRFAEDFSVFNNTPGNFRGSHGPFGDFVAPFTSPSIPDAAQLGFSPSSNSHKRLLSVGSIAAEIASYPNHPPTSTSSLPVPPVEPSRRLSSSPGSLVAAAFGSTSIQDSETTTIREQSPDYYGSVPSTGSPRATKASKKARGDIAATVSNDLEKSAPTSQSQTATPPPSARKAARKLAPKLKTSSTTPNMQSEQGFGPQHQQHPDFLNNTPQQQQMATFAGSPADLFSNYPMSAPATANAFSDAREFWGNADPNMMSMDMDYGANMFATPNTVQRQLEAIDWTQASQATQSYMLGSAGDMSQDAHHLQHMSMTEGDAKQMIPTTLDTASASHLALYSGAYPTPVDDPFGMVNPNGGVNPGLLFSRPPSSSADVIASAPPGSASSMSLAEPAMFERQPHLPTTTAPGALQMTQSSPPQHMLALASENGRGELRRSNSVRDLSSRRKAGDRSSASSPVKTTARPGLSRSQSENRGPRLRGRASLPTLAPAVKAPTLTTSQTVSSLAPPSNGMGITRSASFGGSRPTGRNSPIRMQHHQRQQQLQQQQLLQQQMDQHSRLSSLSSIPEVNTPQAKASVKFMIDASGRARVEADEDEPAPQSTIRRNQSAHNLHSKSKWDSSTDDDSSSSDDEPIIIPSRTTSFALPDPVKPTIGHRPLHSSQRSVSDRSTTSTAASLPGDALFNDPESETETVNNDFSDGAGDAASELKKLRQMRQKRASLPAGANNLSGSGNLFGSVQRVLPYGPPLGGNLGGNLSRSQSMQAVSPTTLTEASLPTPSTASRSHGIRCICGRPDAPPASDGFIVQCDHCDMWLHGRCINITKRTLPQMYICAFCAQTPTARNVRMPASGAAASSPLAHKSFKTFR